MSHYRFIQDLFAVSLLLVSAAGESEKSTFAELGPESVPQCTASFDSCLDADCEEFGANSTATGVGFYQTATEATRQAHQHYICACNLEGTEMGRFGGPPSAVVADAVCRIRDVVFPLPEANPANASCADLGVGDGRAADDETTTAGCLEYCNEVVFRGYRDVVELPEGESGKSGVMARWGTRYDGHGNTGYDCECQFGNATVVVCENSLDDNAEAESGASSCCSRWTGLAFAAVLAAGLAIGY